MTGGRPADILRRLDFAGPAGDGALLERFARERDNAAFAELVRRHGGMVLGVCRRVTGNATDADDAFQAAFLVLAKKAGAIRNPELLGNWLYGVAVRVAGKARRAASRRRVREVQVATMPDPPTPAREDSVSDLGPVLHEELAALPAWYREPIVLCDLRGVSRPEAAKALGVPEGTLSSRLANGRKKLADRLARRGVALGVTAVPTVLGEAKAAVTEDLVSKTCGLVADWAAGGAVAGSVARLAGGSSTVRKTLLFGVMTMAVAAAGVGYAARPGDPPKPADPARPLPALVAAPEPEQKPGDKAIAFAAPRRLTAIDLPVEDVSRMAWSPDGKGIAVLAPRKAGKQRGPVGPGPIVVLVVPDAFAAAQDYLGFTLWSNSSLVGFTPDGKQIVTDLREPGLVSGRHQLKFWELRQPADPTRTVELEADEANQYVFAPNGKSFRSVTRTMTRSGVSTSLDVRDVDIATGEAGKALLTLEGEFVAFTLSANGKRFAAFDVNDKLWVYEVSTGKKLWALTLRLDADRGNTNYFNLRLSPDGRRLLLLKAFNPPFVFDVDSGEQLPRLEGLDAAKGTIPRADFTADGRLVVISGQQLAIAMIAVPPGEAPRTGWSERGPFLSVWDTSTGKLVKTWNREPRTVAFHPTRPVLAVLENNGEGDTRLGLWDFTAPDGKK